MATTVGDSLQEKDATRGEVTVISGTSTTSSSADLSLCNKARAEQSVDNLSTTPPDSEDDSSQEPPPRLGIKRSDTLTTLSKPLYDTYETIHGTYVWLNATFKQLAVQYVPKPVLDRLDYVARQFNGWRFGIISFAACMVVVLLLNLTYAVWVARNHGYTNGYGVIADGNCTNVRRYNTIAHLAINVLSTILLSGSNYTMQCLSAPSRAELDVAHKRFQSLDIGTQSLTNLRYVSKRKSLAWLALSLSSLPLHLFYNSVLFTTVSANEYVVMGVDKSFLQPSAKLAVSSVGNFSYTLNSTGYETPYKYSNDGYISELMWSPESFLNFAEEMHSAALGGTLERLEKNECIHAYAQNFLSTRSNVLLVASESISGPEDSSVISTGIVRLSPDGPGSYRGDPDTYAWICGEKLHYQPCSLYLPKILDKNQQKWPDWKPFHFDVDYCLSQRVEENCRLQISSKIVIVVILFNLFKAILMCAIALTLKDQPLLTIGDAVASFVTKRDLTTRASCLANKYDFKRVCQLWGEWECIGPSKVVKLPGRGWRGYSREWCNARLKWFRAASRGRWATYYTFFACALVVATAWLAIGLSSMISDPTLAASVKYWWSLGVGEIQAETIEYNGQIPHSGSAALLTELIITNCPQPIISVLYVSFNGLLTNMASEVEWSNYARQKKGLRVSVPPEGHQRMTYFLQLPYRFGIPLMALSTLIHWLLSQAIFLVAVEIHSFDGEPTSVSEGPCSPGDQSCIANNVFLSFGWSPAAGFISLLVMSAMAIGAIAIGFRKYKPGIPLAGNQSAVISAACHMSAYEPGLLYEGHPTAAKERLQWGVVKADDGSLTHCAFSTMDTVFPEENVLYK